MIDTIFYFPSSLTFDEYMTQYNNGEISNRTIVFADAQKAIYKGGKKYGGISVQEFNEKVEELYDDSWIKDEIDGIKNDILASTGRINGLNDLVQILNGRLNDLIDGINDDVQDKVEDLFDDAEWILNNFPQDVVQWLQGWNDQIEAYLRIVGYWTIDAYGNRITQWSKIQQQVDAITASVNNLIVNGNASTALSATIAALVDDKIAALLLDSTYAKIQDINDAKQVIEWMYSALKTSASQDESFALILASGKNGMNSAIADIRTYVQRLENGDYVAETELSAKVNNVISSLILQSSNDNVIAGMSTKIDANSDNISAILLSMTGSSSTADIQTRISNRLSGFISTADLNAAKSEIYSAIGAYDPTDPDAQNNQNLLSLASIKTQVDTNTASISAISQASQQQSGFVSKAELGLAVAELFASSGQAQSPTAKASVVALVKDNKSSLELNADDVNINGYLNGGSATFKGNINASNFVTGDSDESGISVMSGEFDEESANTHKAYFAYDSSQGAMTLWFYQNGEWKSMDLSKIAYDTSATGAQEQFITHNVCQLSSENITKIPAGIAITHLYESKSTGKWYTSPDSTSAVAEGTYYKIVSGSVGVAIPSDSPLRNVYRTVSGPVSIVKTENVTPVESPRISTAGSEIDISTDMYNSNRPRPVLTFETVCATSNYCSEAKEAYKIDKVVIDNTGTVTSKTRAEAYYQAVSVNHDPTYGIVAVVEPTFVIKGNSLCWGLLDEHMITLDGRIVPTYYSSQSAYQLLYQGIRDIYAGRYNTSTLEFSKFGSGYGNNIWVTSLVPATLSEALAWTTPLDYTVANSYVSGEFVYDYGDSQQGFTYNG